MKNSYNRIEDKDYDYAEAYRQLLKVRDNSRAIEDIIVDLKEELRVIKEESLLVHAMRLILELDYRTSSPLYEHLQSPMRQALYMIDVYYSIESREESAVMNEERWNRIAILLEEIEITYFVNIGFSNEGDFFHDERDKQVEVSLATFIGYYSNALLSYEEQTLDRIVRYFKPYNNIIQELYGFSIDEALKFIAHERRINNDKLNNIVYSSGKTYSYYANNPKEWRELTQSFIDRGITDSHDWWNQPELGDVLKLFQTNPGVIHVHTKEELLDVDINSDSLQHIMSFFLYDKDAVQGETIYYAEKRHVESHPIIQYGDKFVCPINKFLLEGLYFRIDEALKHDAVLGQKYKQNKDDAFEKKVYDVFRSFFPEKTKFFVNYSVDGGLSENDMLIIYHNTCIIVEIKNCGFRAPFRDPIKAYDRIKRDYKNAIQLGYDQCKRVEDVLCSGLDVDIVDAANRHKLLYHLKEKNIGEVWSIVVTDFKYGTIQTNLGSLLKKEEDALYPWSICIDDLEAFLLLLRKVLKGVAPARFIEYLDYREKMQERLICFDELEICGWYLCDREQFKTCADMDYTITTTPTMGSIFDAYYRVGLGFKNELDMVYKKYYQLPDYPDHFDINVMTGEQML